MEGKIRFQEFSKRNYVFFIAALVILAWHTQIGLDGDSIWFSEQLEETSYMGFLTERYQDWTSRLLIEAGLLCSCYSLKDMNGAGWIVTINNYLFLVFLSLLCIAVWKMPVASWKKYLAFAPIIGTLAVRYFLGEIEKFLPGVVNIVKPVGLKGTYVPGSGWSVLALFFYAGMVAFVLWELCLVWQVNHEDGIFLFAALGIGFGTVFMMCFSPTILISGTRTYLFPRAMRKIAMLAWIFDECREGQIPRPLGRKEQARSYPVACCGVFDSIGKTLTR